LATPSLVIATNARLLAGCVIGSRHYHYAIGIVIGHTVGHYHGQPATVIGNNQWQPTIIIINWSSLRYQYIV